MTRLSAGLLMYRLLAGNIEVLLAHPGGPYFQKKDEGAWTIPKGEPDADEDLLLAAQREFQEETGITPTGPYLALGTIKQKGGKVVHAWAFKGDFEPAQFVSNSFTMEWPPKSGRMSEFPEVDRVEFFTPDAARKKIKSTQIDFIDRLEQLLNDQKF